jgi:hypothetical protein
MKRSLSDMQREKPKESFVLSDVGPEGGKVDVEFIDPKSLHWTKLAALDDLAPAQQIESLVPDHDQFAAFRDDPAVDGAALEWVMNEYRTHYGLGAPGESAGSTGS